ncbi:MAG: glycerophosphodiester phosphodiesterase family protein, partial [Chitinophagaceae bacterium]
MKTSRFYYLILSCLCVTHGACDSATNSKSTPNSFDLQGHRGARGLMPENTIPAMLKALEEGVSTLEMDVVISKDSQVLLSHEPWMNHEITTKPDGSFVTEDEASSYNIYKMPYAEVLTYDVGSRPHPRFKKQQKLKVHKPLLQDIITSTEAYTAKNERSQVQYNIEIKSTDSTDDVFHPAPALFVDILMLVLEKQKIANRATIQSFDIRPLQYLQKTYPYMQTALLVDEGSTA